MVQSDKIQPFGFGFGGALVFGLQTVACARYDAHRATASATEEAPLTWQAFVTLRVGELRTRELDATPSLCIALIAALVVLIGKTTMVTPGGSSNMVTLLQRPCATGVRQLRRTVSAPRRPQRSCTGSLLSTTMSQAGRAAIA